MFETWLTERGRSNTSGQPTAYAVSVSDRNGFLVHIRSFIGPASKAVAHFWTVGPLPTVRKT
jgi:hypothetical protein